MGVKGFLTFIKDNKAYDPVDLVSISQNQEIEIIVDTNSVSRFITEICLKKIVQDYDNGFLFVPVGEYDIMATVYSDFHLAFKNIGVNLIWVVDGPKGADKSGSKQKKNTWIEREEYIIDENDKALEKCDNMEMIENFKACSPIINLEFGLEQLKGVGAEIKRLLEGEADRHIVNLYKTRKSYAIWTNDSDFIFFENVNVLFSEHLSLHYNEKLLELPFIDQTKSGKIFKMPSEFRCCITNSEYVYRALYLESYDQLVAMSILMGNDYTRNHLPSLRYLAGLAYKDSRSEIIKFATFVKDNHIYPANIEGMEPFRKYIKKRTDLRDSITYSRRFYSLEGIEQQKSLAFYDPVSDPGSLTTFLAIGVSTGRINSQCFTIHNGRYYRYICLEKLPPNCASIMEILADIRSRIYPYLLKESLNEVIECYPQNGQQVNVPVQYISKKTHQINDMSDGIHLFDEIWSQYERYTLKFNEKFDIHVALILYLLRYLYVINTGKNLDISGSEFESLFVTVFYQYSLKTDIPLDHYIPCDDFRRMKICPSSRCMTIVTWFMSLYYTAKYICGGALNITECFPTPAAIMNGSTLFAFYENFNGDIKRVCHLDPSLKLKLQHMKNEIKKKYHKEYMAVMYGR